MPTWVSFSEREADIMHTIQRSEVSIADILRTYTFVNRDAAPGGEELAAVLSKGLATGILQQRPANFFQVAPDWFDRLHRWDGRSPNEIEAMLECEEFLRSQDWPALHPVSFTLTPAAYKEAIAHL